MPKKNDEELIALDEAKAEIAQQTKVIVQRLNAWFYFTNWCSSYTEKLKSSDGTADIVLSNQHSSEFAFAYSADEPEHFVLLAQEFNYRWLSKIDIRAIQIVKDGVVVYVKSLDDAGLYISELSFKICASAHQHSKLLLASNFAKHAQIGNMAHIFNEDTGQLTWKLLHLQMLSIPVISNPTELNFLEVNK